MVIGVDIDGVLADFNTNYIDLVREVTGRDLFPKGYTWADIETWSYPETFGYTDAEITKVWDHIAASRTFWRTLRPYASTYNFLYDLSGLEHDVYFITSRIGKREQMQTMDWLIEFGWKTDHAPTVLISSKKGECCHALKVNLYIDDKNENCEDVVKQAPDTECWMLAQPWNSITGRPGIIRTGSIDGFFNRIKSYGE